MTRFHSIQWRLTLSYAAIACFAALALGMVLLQILRGYYDSKEREYLFRNAETFKALVAGAVSEDVPVSALRPQIENLAFISKVRVRILDIQDQELIDTGAPDRPYVISFLYAASEQAPDELRVEAIQLNPLVGSSVTETAPAARGVIWRVGVPARAVAFAREDAILDQRFETFQDDQSFEGGVTVAPRQETAGDQPLQNNVMVNAVSALALSSTFYGFSLGGSDSRIALDASQRSQQQIESLIFDFDHSPVGKIIVSDGPAYGREIAGSVARGGLIAGGIAVLLAAAAGWVVSRQISKPLLALTEVTAHMTAGDLSTRATIARQDELGTLAQSFNTMADRIQEIVITLQRFVADAAHELHTPLTALRTNLELASHDYPSTAIRRAHEQVIRLEKLTDSLLVLSRIEAHSGTERPAPVDLACLIRSASELYASRAEQSGLDYAVSLPDDVPPISGWADQLECVVSNLMENAIKFTPAGGAVSLCLQSRDHELELVVQDSGIGIPAEDLPLLFQRFRRGHNASHYPGSGLGLAITKAIVKAHGGSILAESSPTGTRFTVRLPLAELPQG